MKSRHSLPLLVIFTFLCVGCSAFIRVDEDFKINANLFIQEADKLSIMVDQEVQIFDFRDQLLEVKTAYSRLDGEWPLSLATARNEFDLAFEGWYVAIAVWSIKFTDEVTFNYELMADYLETDDSVIGDNLNYKNSEKFAIDFMKKANRHYEVGRDELVHAIK